MSTFVKLLRLVSQYKWWMLLATLMGFLTIGSSIGLLMTSAYIIAKASLHPDIGQLQVGIVGVRFFGISRGLLRYAERLFSHEVTFNLLAKLRIWFFQAIAPFVPSKTGKLTSGDLLSRVVADIESMEHIFIRVISPPIIATLVAMLMVFILSFYSIFVALAFLVPFLLGGIAVPTITYLLSKKYSNKIIQLRSKLTEMVLDGIDGKYEILAYGMSENYKVEFNKTNLQLIKVQRKMELISGMNESLIGLLMNVAVLLVVMATAPLIENGIVSGIHLSVVALGTMASFEAVLPMPSALQYLLSSIRATERVFEITDKPFINEPILEDKLVGDSLGFEKVSFSYADNINVLTDITLKLRGKNKIAIIGGSGAGKSSIVNLLLKFWHNDSGEIKIDDINYKQVDSTNIRNLIATIPQKVFLFSNTVKNNLLLAKPNATDEELWNALRQAELMDLVESLPDKLDTWIGNHGKQISGGEQKRIAIARALLKDSPIFICDEITANIDSINELKITNTVHSVTKNKALIFITHRLVDMEKFDAVYLVENGKIISIGKHEELISKSDKYKSYFL